MVQYEGMGMGLDFDNWGMAKAAPVRIGIGSDKSFQVQLLLDGAPFDLTAMTAISASFPGASGTPVVETAASGAVSVVGVPGAGRIQISCPGKDTLLMQANPVLEQFQDLQVIVTLSGVAQIDTLSIPGSIAAGSIFSVILEGQVFSYTANAGDTDLVVLTAIAALIAKSSPALAIAAVVSGSAGSALLTLTSTIPALGFSDTVSSNITVVHTRANGGTRAQFVLRNVLNIIPQPYPFS